MSTPPGPRRRPPVSTVLALLALALLAPTSRADVMQVQPNRLDFGTVHVGARVEGSARIIVDPKDVEAGKLEVKAPEFVQIHRQRLSTRKSGAIPMGYCDLELSIDTAKAGNQSGTIHVTVGTARAELPIAAAVLPRKPGLSRVLVVETPFHMTSTVDGAHFDAWRQTVVRAGLDVDYLAIKPGPLLKGVDLAKYDAVLISCMGLIYLQDQSVADLQRFAEGGGRVIVTANYAFRETVGRANRLLIPYGLMIKDTEPRNRGNVFDLEPASITPGPFTEGVKALSFHRPSPVELVDNTRGLVLAEGPPEAGSLVAYARAGEGEVVAIGESLWWDWARKADNAVLLGNLLAKHRRAK